MVASSVELLVGGIGHPVFGPVVACGAGGTSAELLADVAVRLAPVGPGTAEAMLRGLRCFPLLDGWRGAPRCDLDAVTGVIRRVAALVADHPQIAELDANPVIAGPDGATIVDLRVRLRAEGEGARLRRTRRRRSVVRPRIAYGAARMAAGRADPRLWRCDPRSSSPSRPLTPRRETR